MSPVYVTERNLSGFQDESFIERAVTQSLCQASFPLFLPLQIHLPILPTAVCPEGSASVRRELWLSAGFGPGEQ